MKAIQKRLTNAVAAAVLMVTPLIGICQPPPPPNEGGGNPEVPFDGNMNMIFLAAGVLFAVLITVRQLRKRATTA